MRTYENWLSEATTGDLRQMGATPAQIATLKQRREKRGFGFDRGDDRVKKAKSDPLKKAYNAGKPKALPAAADKGSAIVRQKRGGTGKEAIGGNKRKSGPGVRIPNTEKGTGTKTYDRTIKDGSALAKYKPKSKPESKYKTPHKSSFRDGLKQGITGGLAGGSERDRQKAKRSLGNKIGSGIRTAPGKALRGVTKSVANQARGTMQDKGEKMQDAQVTSAKRGVYNP